MGYRQEWCKNMKDRIEDKKDIKLQKEMKQYRKRIYEASGNELAAVLKEIQEYMEQEFNVESMVLLFTELSSLLNEKEESPDILQLIVFLAMQKCRFMQINLFGFGKEIYTMYHDSLCFLRYRLRFLMYPKQLIDIAEEDKTYLAHVYFSLMDFGVDGLLLFVHGLFSSGASFQCPYCGRVYELPSLLPGDESEGKIQPVFRKEHAGVYDPYFMFKHYLDEMQEEDLNSMLPYIYGNFTCKPCDQQFSLMEGLQEYSKYHTKLLSAPSKEELEFIYYHGISARENGKLEQAMYYLQMAYSLQLLVDKTNTAVHASILLEIAKIYLMKEDVDKTCSTAKYVIELLDEDIEHKELLGDAYALLADGLHLDTGVMEEVGVEEILLYYERAIELYEEEMGTGCEKASLIQKSIAIMYGEQEAYRDKGIAMLEEGLKEAIDTHNEEEIADLHLRLADIYELNKDYEKAIVHFKVYLSWIQKEYGEYSSIAAEEYLQYSVLLEKNHQLQQALDMAEKAYEILNHYLLQAERMEQGYMEAMAAADASDRVGALYHLNGNIDKALYFYQNGYDIRLHKDIENKELANGIKEMASIYEEIKDYDKALIGYENALSIYHDVKEMAFASEDAFLYQEVDICNQAMSYLHKHIKKIKEVMPGNIHSNK